MQSLLVLEDNPDLQEVYASVFEDHFKVDFVDSVREFRALLESGSFRPPDFMIVDLTLGDGSILELVRDPYWFEKFSHWPAVVVSGDDTLEILRECSNDWALDFITKPFNNNELLFRCLKVVMAWTGKGFFFSSVSMEVFRKHRTTSPLTAQESRLFNYLASRPMLKASRAEVMQKVWKELKPNKKLNVNVSRLRRKLKSVGMSIEVIERDYYQLVLED